MRKHVAIQRRGTTAHAAVCVALLAILVWGNLVRANDDISQEAAAVLDRYVEVTGGKVAYQRIENRVRTERLIHVSMGLEDSLTTYTARPNKRYTIVESDAMGEVRNGTDGRTVWYLSEQTGPIVETGDAREAELAGAAFDQIVNWRKYYKQAEYAGEETVDGHPCHKLVLTPVAGEEETRFYDTSSGLLVRAIKSRLSSVMPTVKFEVLLSDYRPVDGILMPHEMRQSFDMCGSKREMVIQTVSVKHNVTLPSDRFDPPSQITAAAGETAPASQKRPTCNKS